MYPVLFEIAARTPPWVWLLLAALIALGLIQTRPQVVSRVRLVVQPIAVAVYALASVTALFGLHAAAQGSWIAGLAAGLAFARAVGLRHPIESLGDGRVSISGSWVPLAIYLSVFALRYVAAVSLIRVPVLAGEFAFMAAVSALYGAPIGMITARALSVRPRARTAGAPATARALPHNGLHATASPE